MIFWDTSALLPLLVTEPTTAEVLPILRDQPTPIVWWGTLTECHSAIARREREGSLSAQGAEQARALLGELQAAWAEVAPVATVRQQANLLLLRHPLRAADALQLAAALTVADGNPGALRFFTLDTRLARAARGEGLALLTPPGAPP